MIGQIDINQAMYGAQVRKLEEMKKSGDTKFLDKTTEDKLRKSAVDFEAVFVQQLLNTMDSTVEKSDFMRGGRGEETFKSMLNEQIAQNIASSPSTSFGLAEQIYKQMKEKI